MDFINDLVFLFNKPKVIIIVGKEKEAAKKAITAVLESRFKMGKNLAIVDIEKTGLGKIGFFVKNSSLPIFVAADGGEISEIKKIAKNLPAKAAFIFNFDEEAVRMAKNETQARSLTFGFQEGADFKAGDESVNGGINFKINYNGSIVPFWLTKSQKDDKKEIYAALAAAACGTALGLNLVEISQSLSSPLSAKI